MPNRKEVLVEEHERQHASTRAILSKEINRGDGESSFRVYYGTRGAAVPFMWESQPGTPKHPIFRSSNHENHNSVPPLTPPPSYTPTASLPLGHHHSRKCRKSSIFDIIFSFVLWKNSDVTPVSTLSSSSSSSSSSLSSPCLVRRKNDKSHRRSGNSFSSFGAKSPLFGDEDDNGDMVTQNSVICFGFKKKYQGQGCYSMQELKNAIFAIRGH